MASEPWVAYIDESIRGDVITVGGFIARSSDVSRIETRWQKLKEIFGLDPDDELKFSLSEQHPCRERLDANGWRHRRRAPRMLKCIARMPIQILANTLLDLRSETAPVDFYVDALRWCIRRLAHQVEIDLGGVEGPHTSWSTSRPPRPTSPRGRTCRSV